MRTHLFAATLLLCSTVSAQTNHVTSPPGFLSTEAGEFASGIGTNYRMARYFGAYANGEVQIIDDHLRGNGLKLLTQLDYRSDTRFHSATNSVGRTFSNVQLRLGPSSFSGPLSRVFTLNNLATPTLVFSASMNWPGVTQNQNATGPNNWGVVSFPLSSNFVVTGQTALAKHFSFSGGQLANGAAWSGTTTATYQLDAHFNDQCNVGYYYISTTAHTCLDPHYQQVTPETQFGYSYIYANTYAANPAIAGNERAGKVYIDSAAIRVAPLQSVINAYSLNTANIPLSFTSCTSTTSGAAVTPSLLVDLTQGFIIPGVAKFDGRWDHDFVTPYVPGLAGVQLYMQSAWNDSQTGKLALTRRAMTEIGAQPEAKMLCLYNTTVNGTATAWTGGMDRLPLVRYSYR